MTESSDLPKTGPANLPRDAADGGGAAGQGAAKPAQGRGPGTGPGRGPGAGKGPGVARGPGKGPGKDHPDAVVTAPLPAPPPRAMPPQPAPARPARVRRRHWGVLLTFMIFVATPIGTSAWYLWTRAADQFASTVGFSVRKEDVSSAIEILGGITDLSGSSSSDTDILYEFIQSQRLVADIDAELDLRHMWSLPVATDPVFAYHAPGTIEDLVTQWGRMVRIYYDSGTGLMEVRALAFRPEDATAITTAIYDRSTKMINQLSDIAREDAVRYAREELDRSVDRLKTARAALTAFRNRTQIVDPAVDIQTQAGLLGTLQGQMAEALIELDLLKDFDHALGPAHHPARAPGAGDRGAHRRRAPQAGDGPDRRGRHCVCRSHRRIRTPCRRPPVRRTVLYRRARRL